MSIADHNRKENASVRGTSSRSIEYKTIYFLIFSGQLFVECLYRVGHKLIHPHAKLADSNRESPIAIARGSANSTVPYIFEM